LEITLYESTLAANRQRSRGNAHSANSRNFAVSHKARLLAYTNQGPNVIEQIDKQEGKENFE